MASSGTKAKQDNSKAAARRTSTRKRTSSTSDAKSTSSNSSSTSDVTETTSKVAARAAFDEGTNVQDQREQQAKDQEERQAKELRDGVVSGQAKKAHDRRQKLDRASLRHTPGQQVQGPVGGFVDQLTRRDDSDALEGHFVKIDLNHKDVDEELRESGRDYGVYVEPGELDQDGYPLTALVRLRDETNQLVTVPYAALRSTEYRGR